MFTQQDKTALRYFLQQTPVQAGYGEHSPYTHETGTIHAVHWEGIGPDAQLIFTVGEMEFTSGELQRAG